MSDDTRSVVERGGVQIVDTFAEAFGMRAARVIASTMRIFESSEINIVVAGGGTQGAWKMISGSLRATVSIDAWR